MIARRPLTLPEAIAAAVVTTLAALITVAYVWGKVAPLSPFALFGFAVATAVGAGLALVRRSTKDGAALVAMLAVFGLTLALLLRVASPSLLPPGSGPDLTHHLQLIDYIERHLRLPDASLEPVLAEMTHYTPGLHVVAALAGSWSATSGLRAAYPVVALAVALKLALVFLIALRLLPASRAHIPLALAAVVIAVAPRAYFLDSFVRDSFLAQVFAELFAVALWWTIVVWDERPSALAMTLTAAAGVGAFLTWPMWIGPPIAALVATVAVRGDLPWRERLRHLAIAVGPIALIAALHVTGRTGWIRLAATSGAVIHPSVDTFGWPLLALYAAGLSIAIRQRSARATLLLVVAVTAQATTLYAVARSAGASTPYMALKMFYLFAYPLAVLAVLPFAFAIDRLRQTRRWAPTVAWPLVIVLALAYGRQLTVPRQSPVVSRDLDGAGRWARANLEAACVEYLVPNADTAYWLHLAVLGNPRMTPRVADNDTFDPARNVLRWLQPGGLPYAIVSVPTAPREVFNDADRLEQFGTAVVLRRTGPASCPDAQRFAERAFVTP